MSYKEKILNGNKKKFPVEMPDWEMTVYMRRLSVKETFELDRAKEASEKDKENRDKLVFKLVLCCCYDENDNRIIEDNEIDEITNGLEWPVFSILLDHFNDINGFGFDADKLQQLHEMFKKN